MQCGIQDFKICGELLLQAALAEIAEIELDSESAMSLDFVESRTGTRQYAART